jgi:hypothetical protein
MNDEQRALAVEDLKRTVSSAPKLEDIIKYQLQLGADPRYVAMKFGIEVERCQRYSVAWKAREKAIRESR